MNFRPRIVRSSLPREKRSLKRLEFELALDVGIAGDRPLMDLVRETAESAGGDLILLLPNPRDPNAFAVVRLIEGGVTSFIQVNSGPVDAASAFGIVDEGDMDPDILNLARASVDVLERIRSHRAAALAPRAAVAAR